MECNRRNMKHSVFMWVLVAGMLSQNLLIPVMCINFDDQKHYYTPDPHAGTPPSTSHGSSPPSQGTPSHESHHHTPTHGSHHHTPSTPTPTHGGYHPTPSTPTPTHGGYHPTPSTPTPTHGGYHPAPSTPTPSDPPPVGNCGTPPYTPTPSNPPSSGGGYYNPSPPTSGGSPPTPIIVSPPTSGGSPPTPIIVTPPTTPIDPGTPDVPTPFYPSPTPPIPSVPGTCSYWLSHPGIIWGLLGWWGTLGNSFGVSNTPGFGANMNLLQALSNTRPDGLGALYREGTASWLNSMVNQKFPYTPNEVRNNFVAALGSNKAAGAQAQLFKLANEGRLKPKT